MRPRVGTGTAFALSAIVLCAGALEGQQGAVGRAEPRSVLHERAKRAGGHLKDVLKDDGPVAFASVAELAARSPVIVIGQALAQRAHLSSNGQRVNTDLILKVQESVRGAIPPGSLITITRAGGSYRFKDGAIVTLQRSGYRPARNQGQYLFFLKESEPRAIARGAVAFELAAGSQSQFELDFVGDRVVPAVGGPLHPLATKYDGTSIRALLTELHAAVPRTR